MDNKVTHVIARAMIECGAPAFRFNFRGVGASGGAFDNGRGEADDLAAVVAEGRRRFPAAALWLGGFSFGAFVALRAAARLAPVKLVAVAPPVARFELGSVAHPDCDWMLVQGDADDVVPPRSGAGLGGASSRASRGCTFSRAPGTFFTAGCTTSNHSSSTSSRSSRRQKHKSPCVAETPGSSRRQRASWHARSEIDFSSPGP